jgi:hypothetical protein
MEERLNVAKTAYLNLVNLIETKIKRNRQIEARVEQDLKFCK